MPRTRKNPREKFLDAVNKILSKTDLQQLDRSCNGGDGAYAVEVLNKLHNAFTKVYGPDTIQEGEYDLAELPAVLQGAGTKHIVLGLVTVDLESAGEHYGSDFFTPRGVLSYEDPDLKPEGRAYLKQLIGSYDYWYTPILERDIHVDFASMPPEVEKLISPFHPELQEVMEKKTVTGFLREHPNATLDLMTQDGYFLLTPEQGRRLLEGGSVQVHLGAPDTWHTVEAEALLGQQIHTMRQDESDPNKFYMIADWPRQEAQTPEMTM